MKLVDSNADFGRVFLHLQSGLICRRASWKKYQTVGLHEDMLMQFEHRDSCTLGFPWRPTADDIVSRDWQLCDVQTASMCEGNLP